MGQGEELSRTQCVSRRWMVGLLFWIDEGLLVEIGSR